VIETERLLLRVPTEADVESPPPWLADPEVMDWLGGVEPPAQVVRQWIDAWERFPSGKLLVQLKSDGAVVGRVGANYYDVQTWRRSPSGVPELGWALAREHWGHGYATEAALAVREWLRASRVISLITAANVRSQRLRAARRDSRRDGRATRLRSARRLGAPAVNETERLRLRKPRAEDAAGLLEAFADPEAMRYIGDGSTSDLAGAEQAVERWLERWRSWGIGMFVIERKEEGRVLGRAGFLRWDPQTWEIGGSETEIGWGLARKHWGQGYATEAARALRDWAFHDRGLTRLISIQHGNTSSVRVAEKLGERYERDVDVRGVPTRLYAVEVT
jgi:RimJ/RimL family protein N-acetyltransferase